MTDVRYGLLGNAAPRQEAAFVSVLIYEGKPDAEADRLIDFQRRVTRRFNSSNADEPWLKSC